MAGTLAFYRSSIGKKQTMALSGLIGIVFVFLHMLGNLKIFLGEQAFNDYAEFLRTVGEPALPRATLLWIVRVGLIAAVGLHILSGYQLARRNWDGRLHHYTMWRPVQATFASLTMRWSAVIILLFIIYHLLHLTLGSVHPDFIPGNPYHNVIVGFQVWWVTIFYIAAMIALGFHIQHGFWSMFHTLGMNNARFTRVLRGLAVLAALVLTVGYTSVPVAVLIGLLT